MKWRTGRKVGRTIYRQFYDEPSDKDQLIGVMDTPELAQEVVESVNTMRTVDAMFTPETDHER
jgi:hypothetical protein